MDATFEEEAPLSSGLVKVSRDSRGSARPSDRLSAPLVSAALGLTWFTMSAAASTLFLVHLHSLTFHGYALLGRGVGAEVAGGGLDQAVQECLKHHTRSFSSVRNG